jgi:hypothetical protein
VHAFVRVWAFARPSVRPCVHVEAGINGENGGLLQLYVLLDRKRKKVCLFDACMSNYQPTQILYMYRYHQNITSGWGCVARACRYAPFYLRNSNAQVKSECDYIDEEIGVKSGLGSLAGEIKEVRDSFL